MSARSKWKEINDVTKHHNYSACERIEFRRQRYVQTFLWYSPKRRCLVFVFSTHKNNVNEHQNLLYWNRQTRKRERATNVVTQCPIFSHNAFVSRVRGRVYSTRQNFVAVVFVLQRRSAKYHYSLGYICILLLFPSRSLLVLATLKKEVLDFLRFSVSTIKELKKGAID